MKFTDMGTRGVNLHEGAPAPTFADGVLRVYGQDGKTLHMVEGLSSGAAHNLGKSLMDYAFWKIASEGAK